jgi:hypothetical protein
MPHTQTHRTTTDEHSYVSDHPEHNFKEVGEGDHVVAEGVDKQLHILSQNPAV